MTIPEPRTPANAMRTTLLTDLHILAQIGHGGIAEQLLTPGAPEIVSLLNGFQLPTWFGLNLWFLRVFMGFAHNFQTGLRQKAS